VRSLPSDYTAAVKQDAFPPSTFCRAWESIALPATLEAIGLQHVERCLQVGLRTKLQAYCQPALTCCVQQGCPCTPSVPVWELEVTAGKGDILVRMGGKARGGSRR